MKRKYDGLDAVLVSVSGSAILTSSQSCMATVDLVMENNICISDDSIKQIIYWSPGDGDDDW